MPSCPRCSRYVDDHPAGNCLDRWVHKAFLGKSWPATETPPRYSGNIGPAIDQLLDTEKWPDGAKLSKSGGSRWLVRTDQEVLAEGNGVGLAVCRAALKCPPGGKAKLTATYMPLPSLAKGCYKTADDRPTKTGRPRPGGWPNDQSRLRTPRRLRAATAHRPRRQWASLPGRATLIRVTRDRPPV